MTTVALCLTPWRPAERGRQAKARRLAPRTARLLGGLHEALMGRRTFALAERLRVSESWLPEELDRYQAAKLRRLIDHARAHSPFFRERDSSFDVTVKELADLASFGLITRDDLRRDAWRMCWQGMPAKRLIDFTRGTTEERLAYFWDRRRQAWDKANRLRGHAWHGFSMEDRELHLWPVDPPKTPAAKLKQWLRTERDRLLGELQIDSLHAFSDRLALTWQAWRRFDPERVTAYPSALAQLIRDGRRAGCRLGNPALRAVFLTGETTFDWQRRLIESELGVPTVQMYGVQEAGALTFACEFGSWHISAESALIEIIRDGRSATAGELGEVVVTGLESFAMPVIRYCTGDIVRMPASRAVPGPGPGEGTSCRCGRGLPVLPPVLGRAGDFLQTSDGRWIEPAEVVAALGQVLENGTYQVRQDARGRVMAEVLAASCPRRGWSAAVRDTLQRLVGRGATYEVREVSALHRSLFGKRRYVSSERSRRGLAKPADEKR